METHFSVSHHHQQRQNQFLPDGVYHDKFPFRLHEMLQDAAKLGFDDIVSWVSVVETDDGNTHPYIRQKGSSRKNNSPNKPAVDGFKVHKLQQFKDIIMPKYFKNQTKYKSFLRQLNFYGFVRINYGGPNRGVYTHRYFKKAQVALCTLIERRERLSKSSTKSASANGTTTTTTNHLAPFPKDDCLMKKDRGGTFFFNNNDDHHSNECSLLVKTSILPCNLDGTKMNYVEDDAVPETTTPHVVTLPEGCEPTPICHDRCSSSTEIANYQIPIHVKEDIISLFATCDGSDEWW